MNENNNELLKTNNELKREIVQIKKHNLNLAETIKHMVDEEYSLLGEFCITTQKIIERVKKVTKLMEDINFCLENRSMK